MGREKVGSIYFVLASRVWRVKIGYTENFGRRLLQLQHCSPVALRKLLVIPGATRNQEYQFHSLFHDQRLHGEWFDYDLQVQGFLEWTQDVEWSTAEELFDAMELAEYV